MCNVRIRYDGSKAFDHSLNVRALKVSGVDCHLTMHKQHQINTMVLYLFTGCRAWAALVDNETHSIWASAADGSLYPNLIPEEDDQSSAQVSRLALLASSFDIDAKLTNCLLICEDGQPPSGKKRRAANTCMSLLCSMQFSGKDLPCQQLAWLFAFPTKSFAVVVTQNDAVLGSPALCGSRPSW